MSRRRASASIVANPVLVGAATLLVVVVGVFLAYNASRGLPFIPTNALKFQVSNGANLLPGNEVREGGFRIGIVDRMVPIRLPDGTTGAEVTLNIDAKVDPFPKDSTIDLRPRSVLGLKYVEMTRGTSRETFADGDMVPADQAKFPVDLDQFYNMFDERTRDASRENLEGFGNTFAQRGASLNRTIADAPRFLRHLEPVARVLADEDTQFARFFKELGDAARIVAPVADRYAHSFDAGADTFEAWSRSPESLQATIEKSAPTNRTGIRSFRAQRPFLREFAAFSGSLERAAATLPRTLPRITPALREGIPVVARSAEINEELEGTLNSLDRLMAAPSTGYALRGITRLTGILNPLIKFGFSQRTLLNQASRPRDPRAPSLGSIGARQPVNGEETISGNPMNLHSNVYTAAVTHDGRADCESGQRGYLEKLTTYNDDPNLKIVTDPHIPGAQGPTYTGRPRVPEGQTFTRLPQSGPRLPQELDK
jgi:ABC-type transporter Mla subunit MlaD